MTNRKKNNKKNCAQIKKRPACVHRIKWRHKLNNQNMQQPCYILKIHFLSFYIKGYYIIGKGPFHYLILAPVLHFTSRMISARVAFSMLKYRWNYCKIYEKKGFFFLVWCCCWEDQKIGESSDLYIPNQKVYYMHIEFIRFIYIEKLKKRDGLWRLIPLDSWWVLLIYIFISLSQVRGHWCVYSEKCLL